MQEASATLQLSVEAAGAAAARMTLDRFDVVLYLLTELPQYNACAHRNFEMKGYVPVS